MPIFRVRKVRMGYRSRLWAGRKGCLVGLPAGVGRVRAALPGAMAPSLGLPVALERASSRSERSLARPERFLKGSERVLALSVSVPASSESALTSSERALAVSERAPAPPERALTFSERALALPESALAVPERAPAGFFRASAPCCSASARTFRRVLHRDGRHGQGRRGFVRMERPWSTKPGRVGYRPPLIVECRGWPVALAFHCPTWIGASVTSRGGDPPWTPHSKGGQQPTLPACLGRASRHWGLPAVESNAACRRTVVRRGADSRSQWTGPLPNGRGSLGEKPVGRWA